MEESSDGPTPEELALIDDLTKLPNRRALYLRFVQEIRRAQRHHDSIALLMIDLDHLKQVNDKYGHLNGDAVLVELAATLVRGLREWDVAARYGEDEFALILRETKAGALTLADGIRARVAATTFPGGLKLTISVGVAATDEAVLFTDLIARAERALSTARRRGGRQGCRRYMFDHQAAAASFPRDRERDAPCENRELGTIGRGRHCWNGRQS
jgi:diguanylate cyclase (GGDEF)-like protein